MARKKHEEHESHEPWLVSYADFITPLFAFFVVMYSISSVNEGTFRTASDWIKAALNPIVSPASTSVPFTTGQMAMMQAAFCRTDATALALAEAAHTLKGSSGNLGATHMQQLCGELQTLGRANDLTTAGDRLARLGEEFALVQTALLQEQDGLCSLQPRSHS